MAWGWEGESRRSGGINQPLYHPLNRSLSHGWDGDGKEKAKRVVGSINHSINLSFTQSINHSFNHSLNRSFTQLIIHSIDHSLNPSFNQPIIHSINRSLNHSNRLSCRNSHRVNKQSVFSRRKMKESPELPSRTWTPNAALYKPGPSP